MTDEDLLAAKLKGYTCLMKFKDGEELLLKCDLGNNDDWFAHVEDFINGEADLGFPLGGIAISRDSVKYVKQI